MFDVRFNKELTKKLIKGSAPIDNMTLNHLNWLLEQKNHLCGCIYDPIIGTKLVFLVVKDEEGYKLICCGYKYPYVYVIEDINSFLQFISIDELMVDEQEQITNDIRTLLGGPITGMVMITNNKLYLYDIVEHANENA